MFAVAITVLVFNLLPIADDGAVPHRARAESLGSQPTVNSAVA